MKGRTKLYCKLISKLDYLPRYGRTYRGRRTDDGWKFESAGWSWQRRGHWGLNLLGRQGLLWPYLDVLMGPYETDKEN